MPCWHAYWNLLVEQICSWEIFGMPKRICIVDDQPSLRQMVRFALTIQGIAVEEAADGVEALEKMSNQGFDLIIADWQMPRMDGLEMLRRLRNIPGYIDVPVIMISCRDDIEARKQARALGVLAWIKKPFRLSEIQTVVEDTLDIADLAGSRSERVGNGFP